MWACANGHVFHTSCLNQWCAEKRSEGVRCTCPFCRNKFTIKEEDKLREIFTPSTNNPKIPKNPRPGNQVLTKTVLPSAPELPLGNYENTPGTNKTVLKKRISTGKDHIWHLKVNRESTPVEWHCMMRKRRCAAIVCIHDSLVTVFSTCRYRLLLSGTNRRGESNKWIIVPQSHRISLNIGEAVTISVCLEISLPHGL